MMREMNKGRQRSTVCTRCGIAVDPARPKYLRGWCRDCHNKEYAYQQRPAMHPRPSAMLARMDRKREMLGKFDKETIALRIQETHALKILCNGGDILPFTKHLPVSISCLLDTLQRPAGR